MGDSVKGLTEVQVDNTHCFLLTYKAGCRPAISFFRTEQRNSNFPLAPVIPHAKG